MRLLLAEDDTFLSPAIRDYLNAAGHTVLLAENGREAQRLLTQEVFDAVITDVQMPEASGLHVLAFMDREEIRPPTLVHSAEDKFKGDGIEMVITHQNWTFAEFHNKRKESWRTYIAEFIERLTA